MSLKTKLKKFATKQVSKAVDALVNSPYYIFKGDARLPLGDRFAVSSIIISKSINKIPHARLEIVDGEVANQKFEASNSLDFQKGEKLRILLGGLGPDSTFEGVIVKQSVHVKSEGSTVLVLELKDFAYEMTIGRKNKLFLNRTDTEIIKEIIRQYKNIDFFDESFDISEKKALKKSSDKETRHGEMVQYYCTDWDFLVSRAEAIGKVVILNNGVIELKTPETPVALPPGGKLSNAVSHASAKANAVSDATSKIVDKVKENFTGLEITFGQDIYEFEAETDARDAFRNIKASSWDAANRSVNERKANGQESALIESFNMQHPGELKNEELQAWADSKKSRSNLAQVKGRARISGNKDVLPGDPVLISNFSAAVNGYSIISSVNHYMTSSSAFYTDVEFGYSQEWFAQCYHNINDLPASGLLPSVHGLQPAIVLAITGDPENNYRVKVRMPLVENGEEGVWARLATLDAGNSRGSYFMPEPGDEVVLGFMNDDPRQPVVLGMMYSQNTKGRPPVEPEKENKIKGFYTRSKIKLEFDDDKNGVRITTPKGCEVYVSDEGGGNGDGVITLSDTNKNKIEMNKNGISITTDGELKLRAGESMTLKSKKDISTEAGNTVIVKGDGGAKVNSGANVEIKGAVVKIN